MRIRLALEPQDNNLENIFIRQLKEDDTQTVHELIKDTILTSYHGVYPAEAIGFFLEYHSEDSIRNDAATGYTILIEEYSGSLVGTGTLLGTNVRRVFVLPNNQHRGIGKLIEQELERKAILEKISMLDLDSSLVSTQFWESLGFVLEREAYISVKNGQRLLYYRMTKLLENKYLQDSNHET